MLALWTFINKYWSQIFWGLLSALICFIIMSIGYEKLHIAYTKCKNELADANNKIVTLNDTITKLQGEIKSKVTVCNKRVDIYNRKALEFKSLYGETPRHENENCSDTICSQLNRMWSDTYSPSTLK